MDELSASASMISLGPHSSVSISGGSFTQTNVQQAKNRFRELFKDHVAVTALHNSKQHIDAPRCHPGTRIMIRRQAHQWITKREYHTTTIMWLNGAAGAGKSAIARSLAEQCHEEHLLLAAFFFSRSDALRNNADRLIATIVYQIYQVVPASARALILQAVEEDPFIWSKDIFTQFRVLVVNSCSGVLGRGSQPCVIIIDGLDECIDRAMQAKIVNLCTNATADWNLPFLFFVASRPEPDISAAFDHPRMTSTLFRVNLDDDYWAADDIELFLREKFQECCATHPLRRYIPPNWPSSDAISTLVMKSSGQFIYASVAVKFVTSVRHHPRRQLDVILELRPATDSPFAELDALFSQILSSVEDFPSLQYIISFRLLFPDYSVEQIETILGLEGGDVALAVTDILSLVSISQACHYSALNISHASLEDYLFDFSRSKQFYVDKGKYLSTYLKKFTWYIQNPPNNSEESPWLWLNVLQQLATCFDELDFDRDITEYITQNLQISGVFEWSERFRSWRKPPARDWIMFGLPDILHTLQEKNSPNAVVIRDHLLADFDALLNMHFGAEHVRTRYLSLYLAIISLAKTPGLIPRGSLNNQFMLSRDEELTLFDFIKTQRTVALVAEYLCAPSRSGIYAVGPETLAEAARSCLTYVCSRERGTHSRVKETAISNLWKRARRMNPWKWRQRAFVREVGKPNRTPWLWYGGTSSAGIAGSDTVKPVFKRRQRDIVYAHLPFTMNSWNRAMIRINTPSGWRMASESYWLALHYLSLFLSRAAQSEALLDKCRTATFAPKSQDFPTKSREARRAMRDYLKRCGSCLY